MAWCPHATSHYLSHSWAISFSPYVANIPHWIDDLIRNNDLETQLRDNGFQVIPTSMWSFSMISILCIHNDKQSVNWLVFFLNHFFQRTWYVYTGSLHKNNGSLADCTTLATKFCPVKYISGKLSRTQIARLYLTRQRQSYEGRNGMSSW